jgi:hypothetical protein
MKLKAFLIGVFVTVAVLFALIMGNERPFYSPDVRVYHTERTITLLVQQKSGVCTVKIPAYGVSPGPDEMLLGSGSEVSAIYNGRELMSWTMGCGEYTVTWRKTL